MSDATKIFFTSDLHFGHKAIIGYCNRPFADVDAMDAAMISRWNDAVTDNDDVYVVGDVSFHKPERTVEILRQLRGRIYLVAGNHDDKHLRHHGDCARRFTWIKDFYELDVKDPDASKGTRKVVLCHYALRVWNKSHWGSWHLYGHSHGTLPDDPYSLSFDVGVDCWSYTPVSYAQVKARMAEKKWKPIDGYRKDV